MAQRFRRNWRLQEAFFWALVSRKPAILEKAKTAVRRLKVPRQPAHERFKAVRDACLDVCRAHGVTKPGPGLRCGEGEPCEWFALRLRDEVETFVDPPQRPPGRLRVVPVKIPPEPEDHFELTNADWRRRVKAWSRETQGAFDAVFTHTVEDRAKELLGRRVGSPPLEWMLEPKDRASRAKDPAPEEQTIRVAADLFAELFPAKQAKAIAESANEAARIRRLCARLGLCVPLFPGKRVKVYGERPPRQRSKGLNPRL